MRQSARRTFGIDAVCSVLVVARARFFYAAVYDLAASEVDVMLKVRRRRGLVNVRLNLRRRQLHAGQWRLWLCRDSLRPLDYRNRVDGLMLNPERKDCIPRQAPRVGGEPVGRDPLCNRNRQAALRFKYDRAKYCALHSVEIHRHRVTPQGLSRSPGRVQPFLNFQPPRAPPFFFGAHSMRFSDNSLGLSMYGVPFRPSSREH